MSEETKACPYCTETIKAEDIICPYCGKKDLIQPVATEREPLRRPRRILLILGAIGLIYGAFLPWATIYTFYGSFNLAAFPGYRMFSGGVGLLLLLVAIFAKPQRNKRYTTAATILATIALCYHPRHHRPPHYRHQYPQHQQDRRLYRHSKFHSPGRHRHLPQHPCCCRRYHRGFASATQREVTLVVYESGWLGNGRLLIKFNDKLNDCLWQSGPGAGLAGE